MMNGGIRFRAPGIRCRANLDNKKDLASESFGLGSRRRSACARGLRRTGRQEQCWGTTPKIKRPGQNPAFLILIPATTDSRKQWSVFSDQWSAKANGTYEPSSTIGPGEGRRVEKRTLRYKSRFRDGNGCDPSGMTAGNLLVGEPCGLPREGRALPYQCFPE